MKGARKGCVIKEVAAVGIRGAGPVGASERSVEQPAEVSQGRTWLFTP